MSAAACVRADAFSGAPSPCVFPCAGRCACGRPAREPRGQERANQRRTGELQAPPLCEARLRAPTSAAVSAARSGCRRGSEAGSAVVGRRTGGHGCNRSRLGAQVRQETRVYFVAVLVLQQLSVDASPAGGHCALEQKERPLPSLPSSAYTHRCPSCLARAGTQWHSETEYAGERSHESAGM